MSNQQQQQMSAEQIQQMQQQQAQMEEQKEAILRAVLSPEARERLKRIEVVKPERAHEVEQKIMIAVKQGRLMPPISDDAVKEMLTNASGGAGGSAGGSSSKITFVRKSALDDDW
eukprot:PhM_4_TR2343/c0_g1_i1/m.3215/K06875/PDCD5, TFAR19; programmed cell death protein 5